MSQTPLHDRTNASGLPTPPSSSRPELAPLDFNAQFTATNLFSGDDNARESPATMEPARKRRKLANEEPFGNKTDAEVWDLSDEDILGVFPALLPLSCPLMIIPYRKAICAMHVSYLEALPN